MSRKAESVFQDRVRSDLLALEKQGLLWFVKVQQVSVRGTPDFIVNAYGDFVAIELKRDTGIPPDALQTYNLRKIDQTNGHAYVADPHNWDSVCQEIIQIAYKRKKRA